MLAALLLFCSHAQAYTITRVTVAFTNTIFGTSNYMTLTCNGDTRTWTNSVFDPTTQILTNSTQAGSATSLLNHLAVTPFTTVGISQTAGTNVVLTGAANQTMTVTVSSGWATLTFVTNTFSTGISVTVPDSYTAAQKTNVYSGLAADLNSTSNTNALYNVVLYGTNNMVLHGTNFSFATIVATTAPTNLIVDLKGANFQKLTATNDVNILWVTNGPGAITLDILPNGADRMLTVSTNWILLSTNNWALSGIYWRTFVTNAANALGPRRFRLKLSLDDPLSNPTNVVAEGLMAP